MTAIEASFKSYLSSTYYHYRSSCSATTFCSCPLKSYYSGPLVRREIINVLNFINEDLKTQKQQKLHYDRLKKFKFRQHKYQKQSKLAERPAINEQKEDGFIEYEVKQQCTGVSDQGTKTEELPSQIEINPEVGQSDEGLLEPKSDIETNGYKYGK